ncbi:MAG: hypothetical protein K6U80_20010, partial [Firmicutes bacterium]|nr:hypothetical protein [Bacillota bacterium]
FARRAGANFRWIPWILKFIENWYSNIYNWPGMQNPQFVPKIAIAPPADCRGNSPGQGSRLILRLSRWPTANSASREGVLTPAGE